MCVQKSPRVRVEEMYDGWSSKVRPTGYGYGDPPAGTTGSITGVGRGAPPGTADVEAVANKLRRSGEAGEALGRWGYVSVRGVADTCGRRPGETTVW